MRCRKSPASAIASSEGGGPSGLAEWKLSLGARRNASSSTACGSDPSSPIRGLISAPSILQKPPARVWSRNSSTVRGARNCCSAHWASSNRKLSSVRPRRWGLARVARLSMKIGNACKAAPAAADCLGGGRAVAGAGLSGRLRNSGGGHHLRQLLAAHERQERRARLHGIAVAELDQRARVAGLEHEIARLPRCHGGALGAPGVHERREA